MTDIVCSLCNQPIDISQAPPDKQDAERAMHDRQKATGAMVCCQTCADLLLTLAGHEEEG